MTDIEQRLERAGLGREAIAALKAIKGSGPQVVGGHSRISEKAADELINKDLATSASHCFSGTTRGICLGNAGRLIQQLLAG